MKKKLLHAVAFLVVLSGVAFAANVANYISQTTPGTSDNPLVVNGTWKIEGHTVPVQASFTVGSESSDIIPVDITWKDGNGVAIDTVFASECYQSSGSSGLAYVTTAGTSAFTAHTNGVVESITTGKRARFMSTAAGLIGINVTQTSATVPDAYLCCLNALGKPVCSGALDFN